METSISIGSRIVGDGMPTFLIGELSCNHVGSLHIAKQTIEQMASAGIDAVKLQTDTLLNGTGSTIECRTEHFRVDRETLWAGRYLYDLFLETYTPLEWHEELRDLALSLGMAFISTPYSTEAVDFLVELGVDAIKIASMELSDSTLLEYAAAQGLPLILSRGMSNSDEIGKALDVCKSVGNDSVILLHATSEYPTADDRANLAAIPRLRERFDFLVGLSDHTRGIEAPLAAVALGACAIEKHVTLHRTLGGPDSAFSIDVSEATEMAKKVRRVEDLMGTGTLEMSESTTNQHFAQRSLHVVSDVAESEELTAVNVRSIRPGGGMPPSRLGEVIGCHASRHLSRGEPLTEHDVQELKG